MDGLWRYYGCWCNAGQVWVATLGGPEVDTCRSCGGSGRIFIRPTGHEFAWPGGPALGMSPPSRYETATPYHLTPTYHQNEGHQTTGGF